MTPGDILDLWEAGRRVGPLDRAVLAASAASPDQPGPADWPLGTRNRCLAQLHCNAFGGILRGYTTCGVCGEQLEFEFDGRAVAPSSTGPARSVPPLVPVGRWVFRLPTSRDLAIAARESDEQAAVLRLLTSCCSGPEPAIDWSDADVEAIGQRLSEADPFADIVLHFDCPACATSFDESLDLAAFVWAEIEQQARCVLQDIHVLASAYGWNEGDILSLSAARRSTYVELVQA